MKTKILLMLGIGAIAVLLFGCAGKKHNVDYHGQKSLFQGAKASYAAGEKVELKYDLIATDTDYTFYVDGRSFPAVWDNGAGAYVLVFEMPDHDIAVYCESRNTMVNVRPVENVPEPTEKPLSFTSISMSEAKELFETPGDYVIVDVRRADEFAEGHIPLAINIANESIGSERPDELADLNQRIYIYCRSGNRSKQASAKLVEMGYTNIVEFGGIIDWTGEVEK